MTTGLTKSGVDLDAILHARSTTKIADVNIQSNGGVDISNRFETLASGTAPAVTGFQKAGADLNTLFAAIGTVETITLSNQSMINGDNPGGTAYSGVMFRSDGSIDEVGYTLAIFTQYGAGVQWSSNEPSATGADYDIRCASITSGSFTSSAATVTTWVNLATDRRWYVSIASKFSPDLKGCTAVFEISEAGAATAIDSATITLLAEN